MDETDENIAKAVQGGDTEAFRFLVMRYESKILRYGRKFLKDKDDIKDLTQDVFIKAFTNIKSFDISRKFSAWIYRIAHNEFVNALKKKAYQPLAFLNFDVDVFLPQLVSDEESESMASERLSKEVVDKCLDELDLKYKEVLILSYYEDMSYQEIAEIMRIPVSTVGVRLRRAKEKVREIYEKKYGKYE